MSEFKRASFRCRNTPADKLSVTAQPSTKGVYVLIRDGESQGYHDVALPPAAARGLAAALLRAADHAEGKA